MGLSTTTMNNRDSKIVSAAFRRFAHYGVKKTTISEIATEAGVSRQTLYNAFASKEDLMCGAICHYAQQAVDAIREDCKNVEDIGERLDIAYRHLALNPFESLNQAPHIDEIIQTIGQISECDRDRYAKIYVSGIRQAVLPAKDAIEAAGLTLECLCAFIKSSFTQMKSEAQDVEHLHQLYRTLKKVLQPTFALS